MSADNKQNLHLVPPSQHQDFPTIFVVFGATGDLIKKKIAPALQHLFHDKKLPSKFTIVGSSRRDWSDDDFRGHIKQILEETNLAPDQIAQFLPCLRFHPAQFQNPQDYRSLADKIKQIEQQWQVCANKLFYLAVPPKSYELLFNNLAHSGLTESCDGEDGWTRVIVEKPFGDDHDSAQRLDERLGQLFEEEQIYRIDHYLGKEMVQNLIVLRFANNLFEDIWDKQGIERLDIRLDEELGVEDRGSFYDKVGALKDVGQNHMLQILALVMMENPLQLNAQAIRAGRAKLLESLPQFSPEQVVKNSKRYQHLGYQQIEGVDPDSTTETYFRVKLVVENSRWKDVPITIAGGKKTGSVRKEILITFRHPEPCLCPVDGPHIKNQISIRFDYTDRITMSLWVKVAGHGFQIEEKELTLLYDDHSVNRQYTAEYERLLRDCIDGNQMLFVSTREVAAMWRFIDPIVDAWRDNLVPLETYQPDTLPSEE